jgi:hypothetical protein
MEELMNAPDLTVDDLVAAGRSYGGVTLTRDLTLEKLEPALDGTMEVLEKYGIDSYICEPFVAMGDEVGGSIDLLGFSEDGVTALILDYKFGHNVVDVVNNKQLQFYALCALVDSSTAPLFEKVERFVQVIVQPTQESVYTVWDYSLDTLTAFHSHVETAIEEAREATPRLSTGAHCRWCPAEHVCPLKTGQALKAKYMDPAQLELLSEMLPIAEELESWIKKVKTAAHEQLELGTKIDGYKLVNKRASRVWNDPETAADIVRKARKIKLEDAYDMKLKSPAGFEKMCKAKGFDFSKFEGYISSVSSGTTLAKESDKRPAVTVSVNKLEALRQISS